MQFEIQRDGITGALAFKGTISLLDLVNLRLDRMDLALLADVGGDKEATAADYLLALEMLYRRGREQRPNNQAHLRERSVAK